MSALSIVSKSTWVLAAALLVMVAAPSAAAAEVAPPPVTELRLEVPAGLSVDALRQSGYSGSIIVSGCPAAGAILFQSTLQSPTGDGGFVELPIALEVLPVIDGMPVAASLEPISGWLVTNDPGSQSSVLIHAACAQSDSVTAEASVTITSDGRPPLAVPPAEPPAPPTDPEPAAPADGVAAPVALAEPGAVALAESGAEAPATGVIVGSVGIVLIGFAALVFGRRAVA
ncbi:MAG TPA: hypothetical protein VNP97_12340 [Microbacterium sp.]|nr:hypothetical protein [Microbacterium sp.]